MSRPQPRFKEGNVLRLAHGRSSSIDQSRLSSSSLLFSPRTYEPLSPASPRQPLLSPSATSWTGSLPPTPSSPSFSAGRGSYFDSSRGAAPSREGPILPSDLVSSRKRSRILAPIVFRSILVAACIAAAATRHTNSTKAVYAYASRITNGLSPWTTTLAASRPASPSSDASVTADRLTSDREDARSEPPDIHISTLPKLETPSGEDRYLGYLPHSGFHNQRIELQSALLLGKALNRTVLIPPVWIGWPVPTQYYPDLRDSWTNIMLSSPQSFNVSDLSLDSSLNTPIKGHTSKDNFPCPTCDADDPTQVAKQQEHEAETRAKWEALGYEVRSDGFPIVPGLTAEDCKSYSPECRFTYRDTFLAWDFLVDLEKARSYILEDRQKYDFRFTDEFPPSAPLIQLNNNTAHWVRDVSIAALRQLPQRILLVGSMHGTGRVRLSKEPEASDWASALARSMAFSNPWLLDPAEAIVDRLGGASNFVGVHARVGDGQFARHARTNMEHAWRLLADRLQVEPEVAEEMWQRVKSARKVVTSSEQEHRRGSRQPERNHLSAKRAQVTAAQADASASSSWAEIDSLQDEDEHFASTTRRHEKRNFLGDLWRTLSGGGEVPSDHLRNLTCRGPLHSERRFSAFNTPLYLATDSRWAESDKDLAVFFRSFPCTFVLSDFSKPDPLRNGGLLVDSVNRMERLVNELDGVRLGRLFLPFLEAIVAAKASVTVGTERSTFSAFASSDLHDAYHAS
ncbi:hypothetical protein JCM10908_004149 [Rhodotorula pacifica]|uniref:uncharacterized protein n=1 Tax=Rhodotorula pacifica TaxID=1495444 RepID=UPI00317C95B1